MRKTILVSVVVVSGVVGLAAPARAQFNMDALKKEAGKTAEKEGEKKANEQIVKKVNAKLLTEGRKNQCAFKTDSDQLMPGCDAKMKKLASQLVDAKKALDQGNVRNFKFVVSGHTDTTGKAAYNKALSKKRAAVIVRELVAKGIAAKEIEAVGMGSERPLVKPDNTAAKRKKNRRYEIQVKL
jgi:OOP family OmpA-OmpF porin